MLGVVSKNAVKVLDTIGLVDGVRVGGTRQNRCEMVFANIFEVCDW